MPRLVDQRGVLWQVVADLASQHGSSDSVGSLNAQRFVKVDRGSSCVSSRLEHRLVSHDERRHGRRLGGDDSALKLRHLRYLNLKVLR